MISSFLFKALWWFLGGLLGPGIVAILTLGLSGYLAFLGARKLALAVFIIGAGFFLFIAGGQYVQSQCDARIAALAAEYNAKSQEAIDALKQQVADARRDAQAAADQENEKALADAAKLQQKLREQDADFKTLLGAQGNNCRWTPELLNRL